MTNLESGVSPLLLEYTSETSNDYLTHKAVNNILDYEVGHRLKDIRGKFSDFAEIDIPKNPFKINSIGKKGYYDDRNYSTASYSWIGYVTCINKGTVKANLRDIKNNSTIKEEVEFNIQDLDNEDAKMVEVGSVFYWSIGYSFRNGTKRKESFIRLKRLPSFTQEQIDKALDWAKNANDNLNWD